MTRRSTYAVRALFHLAQGSPDKPQLTADIARAEGIPQRFLEAILRELSRQGILNGRRGRGGGYALRRDPEQIDLSTVIRIVDGPILGFPCLDGEGRTRCAECPGKEPCAAQIVLSEIARASHHALEEMTLAELVRRVQSESGAQPTATHDGGALALPRA